MQRQRCLPHYHELTELEGELPGVKNFRVTVREIGEDIVFLRKIVRSGLIRASVFKSRGLPAYQKRYLRAQRDTRKAGIGGHRRKTRTRENPKPAYSLRSWTSGEKRAHPSGDGCKII